MKIKRVIRRGTQNSRVEYEDGTIEKVPNSVLDSVNVLDGQSTPEPVALAPITPLPPPDAPHRTVAERFSQIESLVDLVIGGPSPSLVICGDAGIGKTHLVRQRLQKSGLNEQAVSADAPPAPESKGSRGNRQVNLGWMQRKQPRVNSYLFVKGYSSPMGLFSTLHNNRSAIIVFDDCDSVFKDAVSVNILKSALDSYDTRIVSWVSTATEKMGLESRFEFKGKIIFISNIPLLRLDAAVKSRSFIFELSLTKPELFHRMNEVLINIEPSIAMDIKLDALNHLGLNIEKMQEFNMRTLIKAIRLRHSDHPDWKDMILKFA